MKTNQLNMHTTSLPLTCAYLQEYSAKWYSLHTISNVYFLFYNINNHSHLLLLIDVNVLQQTQHNKIVTANF
jgi:hypothetical protein